MQRCQTTPCRRVAAFGLAVAVVFASYPLSADEVNYSRQVAPILTEHCLTCHGPDEQESGFRVDRRRTLFKGGDSGEPAVVEGSSDKSLLFRAVAGLDPDLEMPPDGERLSDSEIAVLRAWIDQGAKLPESFDPDSGRLTTDHWSFQPVKREDVPDLDDPWAANPIDAFVLRGLAAKELRPSAPADRRTAIRRLFLVMHGLPPTVEQVDKYVSSSGDPKAWEHLVDRVLANPRFGERWAAHWLDVVRFGETHGFETNRERPNAWQYRDYVIDAFNTDKPYDLFVREQIAGDAVGVDVATGFLVAGPYDLVKSSDVNLTLMQRQDELADIVNTTGTTFLGLTVGCARCHNHKFDPITQTDYYSMQAVFAGVRHGERPLPVSEGRQQELARVEERVGKLRQELTRFIPKAATDYILIDDATISTDGKRGIELLTSPRGKGTNPAGADRGFADDPGSDQHSPNISGGQYTWWTNEAGTDVAAYRPFTRGRYRIWLSWGNGHVTHTKDAVFLVDRDGNPETRDDQETIATVDQQRFADGSGGVVSKALWSGLKYAGLHQLEPSTSIIVRGGDTGTAITADVVVLESVADGRNDDPPPSRPTLRPVVNARHNVERIQPTQAQFVRFTCLKTNSGSEPCIDELEVFSNGANVALAAAGAKATSSGNFPNHPLHQLKHINDGEYGNGRSWISNEGGRGWVQIELAQPATIDRIEWARDRQSKYSDRLATDYRIEAALEPGQWRTIASSSDRIPFKSGEPSEPVYDFDSATPELAASGRQWLAELTKLQAKRDRLKTVATIYAGRFEQPGPTHRLYRGEPTAKREQVGPDALEVVGSLGLNPDSPEQQRRITFARWVTSPENPLTARVMVNRVWQHVFGTGLVDTPSDFGANGTPPSHPELLDWLADEFVQNDWSVRHILHLMLTSNTFRQDSQPRNDGLGIDAGSRLLWRFPPRRLEAESIRDSTLAVSGSLNPKAGGPGFSAFEVQMENVRHYFPKKDFGPDDWRRMIYMTKVRQEKDSVFGAFDCPDASQVMPKRSRSTTPLQALNLLNSRFVLQQAELMAQRLERDSGGDQALQITSAFRLCFARDPEPEELSASVKIVDEHGLTSLCRALLNANEFLFIP